LAAKDAQFSGASNEPGFRPIGARGAELRVLQRARGDRARILVLGEYELWRSSVFSADADYEKVANIAQITTRHVSGRIGHKFKTICRRELQKVPKKGVSPTKTFSISVRFLSPKNKQSTERV
jgi:hypothetical protein